MSAGFNDFCFQDPMPSFQFRKMRFHGHAEVLLGSISAEHRPALCHVGIQSRVCLATGAGQGANFRELLRLKHSLARIWIVPAIVFNDPSGASPAPLLPPPVYHFLGRENCDAARPVNRSLCRLWGRVNNPGPLASARGNLDLVPDATVLHDVIPLDCADDLTVAAAAFDAATRRWEGEPITL